MAKRALSNVSVEETNVSAGGDLPVVIADPTTPTQKLAVDSSGRVTIVPSGTQTVDTELPAAALLADNAALPTAPLIGVVLMGYDGTNVDFARVDTTGSGNLRTQTYDAGSRHNTASDASDGMSGATHWIGAGARFNGSNWDREYNNYRAALLASAARTATVSSATQTNRNGRGVRVDINVTAITDTPSITVAVEVQDGTSGNWIAILTSAAFTTTGQKPALIVYPGCVAVANEILNQPLPRTWRVTVTHGDADSITYSVDAVTLV